MTTICMQLVDPTTVGDQDSDQSFWHEWCIQCGTDETNGHMYCDHCDDLAA